jgi:hypothetical protein
MTRAWFRRRLDTDPRRWVLLLAAIEGLGAYALKSTDKPLFFESGVGTLVLLAFLALAPALGVVGMLAHGRLLWWTGKVLGGRARPHEIHAAFAWSELPFVVAVMPLVIAIALRTAAALVHPLPGVARVMADLAIPATEYLAAAAAMGAFAGIVLYVRFLGEAQGFGAWRALANHLLAAAVGLALLFGGIAVGARLSPGSAHPVVIAIGLAASGALAAVIEVAVRVASRRAERGPAPTA